MAHRYCFRIAASVFFLLLLSFLSVSGPCRAATVDGYPQWKKTRIYISGDRVYWQDHHWQARYWSQGDEPGAAQWGPWTDLGEGALPDPFGPIQPFPESVFAPYIDVLLYPTPDLGEIAEASGVVHYTLAFITSKDGEPAWGGVIPLDDDFYLDEIEAVRRKGGDVILSFGGANGTELALAETDVGRLQEKYQAVIDRYRASWVDFDIEGMAVADKASIDRRNKAIKGLQVRNPGLFTAFCLPVLPTGLTPDGMHVLENAKRNNVRIDLVNIMAMDYGAAVVDDPADLGPEAIRAGVNLFNQLRGLFPEKQEGDLWKMIGITPMIGRNDTAPLVFYPQAAAEVLDFAKEKNIKMLGMWSVARDQACPNDGAHVSATCSGIAQDPWAFSSIFRTFTRNSGENRIPVADFSYAASRLQVTFKNLSFDADGDIIQYNWRFGDGGGSTLQNPVHTYAAAGIYEATLSVEDNGGAIVSKKVSLQIDDTPANIPPTADFYFNVEGLTVTFYDQSSDTDGAIVSRQWDFGDPAASLCDTIKPWDRNQNWTEYKVGDLRTHNDRLWECSHTGYAYHEPSGPHGRFGWTDKGACAEQAVAPPHTAARRAGAVVHTYRNAGTYSVTLTIVDDAGASDSKTSALTLTR